jgi:acyl-[acyl-carrier-protein]-phospholipid O-acyltransferase/long-chain-fatty-acid--[acyl-carrier-protein] ligase
MGVLSVDLCLASPASASGAALIPISAFLAAPADWRVVGDLFGIALFGGVFVVPLYALLQVASDEAVRARTIAANNVVNAAAMVVAAVATVALVAAGVTVPGLFLVTGIATLAVAGIFWRIAPGLTV